MGRAIGRLGQAESRFSDRSRQYALMINWWDIYALLRRQGKPVEWLVLPDSSYEPERPMQRLMLQEGSVDWFTFWLKGEEDPDPAKAEQHLRWRELRNQQE